MAYKKKITILSGIIGVLALIYVLTIVFDSQRRGARSDMYSWLESRQTARISRITITTTDEIVLERKEGTWFVFRNGRFFPARQARIFCRIWLSPTPLSSHRD